MCAGKAGDEGAEGEEAGLLRGAVQRDQLLHRER